MTNPIDDFVKGPNGNYIWLDQVRRMLGDVLPGVDWTQREMERTPERFAKMLIELTTPDTFEFTTFPSDVDEIVLVRDIPFVSLCAHHIVPFVGVAHIAYIPQGKVGGLSKFARLVQAISKGLWNQEALTQTITAHLEDHLQPVGSAVIMSAEHLCMTIRGVQTPGTRTTTSSMRGAFADHDRMARSELFSLLGLP